MMFFCGGTLAVAIYIIIAASNHCLPTLHGAPRNSQPPPSTPQYLPENPAAPASPAAAGPTAPNTPEPTAPDLRNFPDQRLPGRKRRSLWSKIKKLKRRSNVAEGSGEGSGEAEDNAALISDGGSEVSSKWASASPSAWSSVSQRKFLQFLQVLKYIF